VARERVKEQAQSAQNFGVSTRRWILGFLLSLPALGYSYSWFTFPSDQTPEGAYLRIVKAVNQGKAASFFAYTEEAAQHACFTIRDYRKKALSVASEHYPPEDLARLQVEYGEVAAAVDGADVFAILVRKEGWMGQLRKDVSGIAQVEKNGPRATIVTSKGTRYAMRKRPEGIWGLTAFTPTLVDEAERAARDFLQVERAAQDFARAR
jgi:hypothetical protein